MPVCYILMHNITDLERYQKENIPATGSILTRYEGELVGATFEIETVDWNPPGAIRILRFPTIEAGRAFANDPEYQPLKKIRLEATTGSSAILMPGFHPSEAEQHARI